MHPDDDYRLSQSLALANRWLATRQLDNLDLDLPPADGSASGFDAPTLAAIGTLYLQAELELAGIIPAAEALVEARASLELPSERVAERLERFAQQQRDWYDQPSRNQLFARVFGTGPAATNDAGGIVNRDFEQRMVAVCAALDRYATDASALGGRSPAENEVRIRVAVRDLLANLELRRYGNTVFAARRVQAQLEASIDLLKDPDVSAIFHTRGFWPTLQRILAPNSPDIARLVERGRAGQRLLGWVGGTLGTVDGLGLSPESPVLHWAIQWLEASGLSSGAGSPVGSVR